MNRFKKWLIPVALVSLLLATLIGCSSAPASLGETFDPSGNPFVNRFSDVKDIRTATFVVAASDSEHKYETDYFCNGTDDHVQIQAAIDALPATGGEVFLLDGTYNVEVSIDMDSYQTLRGCGRNTIVTTTTTALDIITATGGDGSEKVGILIADLRVDGTIGGAVNNDNGIKWTYVDNSQITNVWVNYNKEEGIYLDTSDNNRIIGNHISLNVWDGIYLGESNNNTITGNVFENGESAGITLYSSFFNTVVGNTVQSQGNNGMWLWYAEDNIINGNAIQGNAAPGIYISEGYRNTITGNIIEGNGMDGIQSFGCFDSVISSNVIRLNGDNGINLYWGDNNSIIGNTVLANSQTTDNAKDNILIEDADYNLISDNLCRQGSEANRPRYGINIGDDDCDSNRVVDNDLYDSGKTGAFNDAGYLTELPEIFIFYPDPDGNIGRHPALVLTDGSDITARFELLIPMEFEELVRAQVIIVAGGTGNMRKSINVHSATICTSSNYNAWPKSITGAEVAVTIDDLECIDISDALVYASAGHIMGIEFIREGSHVNDTVGADCYLIGFRMQYV